MVDVLRAHPLRGDTTSIAVADADGNACALTTSLGLSSGVWLADLGIHLNSMLGEGELVRGTETPGRRMGSMMSPLIAVGDEGPVLVAGAAGGSRIRSALLQILVNVLHRGMSAADAIRAPRLNPVPGRVHVEPGLPPPVLARLEQDGDVARWPALDSYFGGVAAISLDGPGADPRRGGDVRHPFSDVS
jgi:gamma-glutamyltranspeptidase / glutathione hydrolase